MAIGGPRVDGWTVVLRRQPVRMVEGRAEGGYTDVFELICCDCGDDPGLDYREVASGLQLAPRALPDRGRCRRLRAAPQAAPAARGACWPGTVADAG